jgi:hypothetical protein
VAPCPRPPDAGVVCIPADFVPLSVCCVVRSYPPCQCPVALLPSDALLPPHSPPSSDRTPLSTVYSCSYELVLLLLLLLFRVSFLACFCVAVPAQCTPARPRRLRIATPRDAERSLTRRRVWEQSDGARWTETDRQTEIETESKNQTVTRTEACAEIGPPRFVRFFSDLHVQEAIRDSARASSSACRWCVNDLWHNPAVCVSMRASSCGRAGSLFAGAACRCSARKR